MIKCWLKIIKILVKKLLKFCSTSPQRHSLMPMGQLGYLGQQFNPGSSGNLSAVAMSGSAGGQDCDKSDPVRHWRRLCVESELIGLEAFG